MSLSGPQAIASLDEALRDIRREEDEVAKRLARSGERVAKIRETEADLVRQLARLRLDPAAQAELTAELSIAEAKARDMLKAHARDTSRTEKALGLVDTQLTQLAQARADALKQLGDVVGTIDQLRTKVGTHLAKDAAFATQKGAAAQQAQTVALLRQEAIQAEADHAQKGQPYRDDPLFSYLLQRGYGTSQYRGRAFTRTLDSWVAGLIGFAGARANFLILDDIPQRLTEMTVHQQELAQRSGEAVLALETAALDAAGGGPLREQLARSEQQIAQIDGKITATEDQRDSVAKTMSELAEGADPAFEQALATLADSLKHPAILALLADARRAGDGPDATLMAQIDETRGRFKDEDAETDDQRDRLKILEVRRRELEDILWAFKTARFDDPRSSIGDDRLVGELLNQFLRGGITASGYWDLWRRNQSFVQPAGWTAPNDAAQIFARPRTSHPAR